jgi:hypothetical protein
MKTTAPPRPVTADTEPANPPLATVNAPRTSEDARARRGDAIERATRAAKARTAARRGAKWRGGFQGRTEGLGLKGRDSKGPCFLCHRVKTRREDRAAGANDDDDVFGNDLES